MKSQRQQLILKIISERHIDTQESLQKALCMHSGNGIKGYKRDGSY